MTSRLKRLVHRNKDDAAGEERSDHDGQGLPTVPYAGASTGQLPITGTHPIRGSSEHTSSSFEPDHSSRRRRSKRFSQSSLSRPKSQLLEPDIQNFQPQQDAGIPHADALYESPRRSIQAIPNPQRHDPPRGSYPPARQGPLNSHAHHDVQTYHPTDSGPLPTGSQHHPTIRQVPPSRTTSHEQTSSGFPQASLNGQDIIDRAQYNSEDIGTAVTMAPAVTHETIHQHIHHVREEQITREIHDQEIYHRMLPVIDVEVLPARHFLPAEGGGLVEIDAEEAPGRGKHWIIAETASRIPSKHKVNQERREFSARTFEGSEGDDRRYIAPEGHLVTEQTWVHPPELETGARDTGQSWPLEFDRLSLKENDRPKSGSKRSGHHKSIDRKPVGR